MCLWPFEYYRAICQAPYDSECKIHRLCFKIRFIRNWVMSWLAWRLHITSCTMIRSYTNRLHVPTSWTTCFTCFFITAESAEQQVDSRPPSHLSSPLLPLFSGRLHGLRVVRVVRVQQVLRQRPHHPHPHDQAGAAVRRQPLSRDHPEEEVQDPKVPNQKQGGEGGRRAGRRREEEETRQTERGSGRRRAARSVQDWDVAVHSEKLIRMTCL